MRPPERTAGGGMTPRTDEYKRDWRGVRPAEPVKPTKWQKWRARLSNAAIVLACVIALCFLYARSQGWNP